MWRYVKEAFFVRVPVPALGDLPVNVMAVAGFGILGPDAVVLEGNREALRNLEWVYLKLLVAESHLRSHVGEDEQQLRQRIGQLEADLKKTPESQSLRESKSVQALGPIPPHVDLACAPARCRTSSASASRYPTRAPATSW